jgi:hypothetical protein
LARFDFELNFEMRKAMLRMPICMKPQRTEYVPFRRQRTPRQVLEGKRAHDWF